MQHSWYFLGTPSVSALVIGRDTLVHSGDLKLLENGEKIAGEFRHPLSKHLRSFLATLGVR